METNIEEALVVLRPALQADGFELVLDRLNAGGQVEVGLVALPAACLDCLVPDAQLVQILETSIRKTFPGLSGVTLNKRGFDAVVDH